MPRTDLLYHSGMDAAGKTATGWWRAFSPLSFSLAAIVPALLIGILVGYVGSSSKSRVAEAFTYPLYTEARGVETVVSPAVEAQFYTLFFYRSWLQDYDPMRAELRGNSGSKMFSVPVNANAAGDAIHVLVPARKLASGKYTLVMLGSSGGNETELARFPFTLRLQ